MPPDFLSQQPLIERYLKKAASPLSAFSFVNIFLWQDFFRFSVEEIDGHLCIFAADEAGTFMYLPPLAKTIQPEVIEKCFLRMKTLNKGRGVTRIENVSQEQLTYFSREQYTVQKKGHEYVYSRRDVADLKGDAFKSKRNAVNHFVKHYQSEYCPFEKNMAEECTGLYEKWAKDKSGTVKDEMHLAMIEDNRIVHRRMFNHFQELSLVGRVLKVDGRIIAYTFGYFLNDDTFCDLAEIADAQFKGAATYIFWQLCNEPILKNIKFINVMDDMVPESVNQTKISFRPAVIVPSYIIK